MPYACFGVPRCFWLTSASADSVIDPCTGKVVCKVIEGKPKDVDVAIEAARRAFDTTWGLKVPGTGRARLLYKLSDLIEAHGNEISALEALDCGKSWLRNKGLDVMWVTECLRYYAGWADKIHGSVIETTNDELVYTRREPIGVCAQIIPWNFPRMCSFVHRACIILASNLADSAKHTVINIAWKVFPALAAGNTVILKPAEHATLTALFFAQLVNEAGFPPGVVNVVNGIGTVIGKHLSEHPNVDKVKLTSGA